MKRITDEPTDYNLQPIEKDWVAVDAPAHLLA
jgi:hypothetical protein